MPVRVRKSACSEPWKNRRTAGFSASSRLVWLSAALRNQRLPSSSTFCTLIGRAPPLPRLTAVQKKQLADFFTTSRICSTASSPFRSSRLSSGWLALIESMRAAPVGRGSPPPANGKPCCAGTLAAAALPHAREAQGRRARAGSRGRARRRARALPAASSGRWRGVASGGQSRVRSGFSLASTSSQPSAWPRAASRCAEASRPMPPPR